MKFYPGITLVTLGVENVERAGAFYERLGWRRSKGASQAAIMFFALNNLALALFPRDALAADAGLDPGAAGQPRQFSGVTLAQNHGSRSAVDSVIAGARAAGADIVKSPCDTAWGGYHGVFADADGHIWEICHNPFFPLSANGTVTLPP